jgi:short-subunit dehydrogenase
MALVLRPLRQQVMVITGASSGIGLATAKKAVEYGAKVVLAARNGEALADIVKSINEAGGQAIYVVADVGRRDDLERVANAAIERFGKFDTWINNAGHSIWGRLEEVSDEDHRRLFETNFWGVVNGSLIAVKHLRQRGGALINMGSVASDVALPIQGMYSASKHAVKGFTDALRMELEEAQAPISVTLIKPTSINTPFPEHAKNYCSQEPKLPPPVYEPEEVAYAILDAATHPQRDIYVGGAGKAMTTLASVAPKTMDWVGETFFMSQQFRNEQPRNPEGALHRPGRGGDVRGREPGYVLRHSLYTRAALHPWITAGVVAAGAVLLGLAFTDTRKAGVW